MYRMLYLEHYMKVQPIVKDLIPIIFHFLNFNYLYESNAKNKLCMLNSLKQSSKNLI